MFVFLHAFVESAFKSKNKNGINNSTQDISENTFRAIKCLLTDHSSKNNLPDYITRLIATEPSQKTELTAS